MTDNPTTLRDIHKLAEEICGLPSDEKYEVNYYHVKRIIAQYGDARAAEMRERSAKALEDKYIDLLDVVNGADLIRSLPLSTAGDEK